MSSKISEAETSPPLFARNTWMTPYTANESFMFPAQHLYDFISQSSTTAVHIFCFMKCYGKLDAASVTPKCYVIILVWQRCTTETDSKTRETRFLFARLKPGFHENGDKRNGTEMCKVRPITLVKFTRVFFFIDWNYAWVFRHSVHQSHRQTIDTLCIDSQKCYNTLVIATLAE